MSNFFGIDTWIIEHWIPLAFYLVVILVVVWRRKKLEWQGAFGLYKTQIGVKTMQRWSTKYRELFRWLGYVGVGVGFVGMVAIVCAILQGLWNLVFVPNAPPVVAPVVPGFAIPGAGITIPLITGWLALFVVIVIHEFSHGVVSKSHGIPIKSSGLLVFGPIIGAFVEPDEEKLKKSSDIVQYSIFAAGPFSNVLAAVFFFLLMSLVLSPLAGVMTSPVGAEITAVTPDTPAAIAGLEEGMLITAIDGETVETRSDFVSALEGIRPGEAAEFLDSGGSVHTATAAQHPDSDNLRDGYIGVYFDTKYVPVYDGALFGALLAIVQWLAEWFLWIFFLSLGIGLANLLPLGPVDGGRMIHKLFGKLFGEERGKRYWMLISKATFAIIIILLIVPFIIMPIFKAVG